ncbi:F0F1 ATP synthase subunit B [Bartonella sp. CB189]|uniref:F0F1 ATP synthase subunit B n=1 Tax=Bartonella sp. CB189 TaxID=3112254 RepID=UPI002F961A2A
MFISSAYAQTPETPLERIRDAAEHADRVFPPFDLAHFSSHIFWLAISFGFFYFFVSRVIVPRIGGVIEMRRDRIASDLDQAVRIKQEADSVVEDYERKLAEARVKAHAIAHKAGEEIRKQAEIEQKEVEENLEKKLTDAEKQIEKIRNEAMKNVGSIAEEMASEIVKKLIDVDVSKETVTSAVRSADYRGL